MLRITREYDFDDVIIPNKPSSVNSPEEVDISVDFYRKFSLSVPFIASPMKGITDYNMINLLGENGSMGIFHRFYENRSKMLDEIRQVYFDNNFLFGVSVGSKDDVADILELLYLQPNIIVIDVANGGTNNVNRKTEEIRTIIDKEKSDTLLMVGNVTDYKSTYRLREAGAHIVRVGIGGGQLCLTRNQTGIGRPQISALDDCSQVSDIMICADGGIRNGGDIVKAIGAGADFVMIGSLFGHCYEAPNNDFIYGMASKKHQTDMYNMTRSIEGLEKAIKKEYSVKELCDNLAWNIKAAGTYLDAENLDQMRANITFVEAGRGTIKQL